MSQPPYPPPPADGPQDPRTAQLPAAQGPSTGAHPHQPSQPVFHQGLPPQGPPPQPAAHQGQRPGQQGQGQQHTGPQGHVPPGPQATGPHATGPQGPPPGMTGPQEYRLPQGYDPAYPAAPTGPMDWVPGFPGEQPPPHPSAPVGSAQGQAHDTGRAPRVSASQRTPADRATLTATVLGVLGLVVLELGLSLSFGLGSSVWSALPTWSGFATLAALVALVPFVPSRGGLSRRQAWQVGAAGGAGLLLFWVLVVLPGVATDQGFVLTAGVALSAGALWLVHDRRK